MIDKIMSFVWYDVNNNNIFRIINDVNENI